MVKIEDGKNSLRDRSKLFLTKTKQMLLITVLYNIMIIMCAIAVKLGN